MVARSKPSNFTAQRPTWDWRKPKMRSRNSRPNYASHRHSDSPHPQQAKDALESSPCAAPLSLRSFRGLSGDEAIDAHSTRDSQTKIMNSKRSTSPTGWWIVALLERQSDPARAPYWNNYRLIKAQDWRTAFRRATEMGRQDVSTGNEAFHHRQEFIGVTDLVPLYEPFEDGAEILWQELWLDDSKPDQLPLDVYSESHFEAIFQAEQKDL